MNELCEIGLILKRFRDEDNMSLRNQSAAIGISTSYLFDICYGHRFMSYEVFKKILKNYEGRLTTEDFTTLGVALNSPDVYERFKEITGIADDIKAVRDFTYIVTGEVVL